MVGALTALFNVFEFKAASGGGDGPESVADGLHAVQNDLAWRKGSTKICVLISDAPAHGMGTNIKNAKIHLIFS